jgi:ADP-ribose pyrophosphatase YjhB (NUDIX family)
MRESEPCSAVADRVAVGHPVLVNDANAVLRPTVRVLLLDDLDRVLLFRAVRDEDGTGFWFPPGGALENGETHEMAARRELTEETGWHQPVLGPEIGRRRHVVAWGGVTYDCRERWFLSRVTHLTVDTAGFTPEERESVQAHRWWPGPELAAATERLTPANLSDVVTRLLREGAPSQPLELPV